MTNENEAMRQRRKRRYRILRDIGVPGREARGRCQSVTRFERALAYLGVDPDAVDPDGELRMRRAGGRPRLCTPQSEAKADRYRALRDAGLDALEANSGAQTPGTFARAVRVLALKGVRVECADLLPERSRALTNNRQSQP